MKRISLAPTCHQLKPVRCGWFVVVVFLLAQSGSCLVRRCQPAGCFEEEMTDLDAPQQRRFLSSTVVHDSCSGDRLIVFGGFSENAVSEDTAQLTLDLIRQHPFDARGSEEWNPSNSTWLGYSSNSLLGGPDIPNDMTCSEYEQAWASVSTIRKLVHVETQYLYDVTPIGIQAHEMIGGPFILRVSVSNSADDAQANHRVVWEGKDTTPCAGWFSEKLCQTGYSADRVILETDQAGWKEMDTVTLHGRLQFPYLVLWRFGSQRDSFSNYVPKQNPKGGKVGPAARYRAALAGDMLGRAVLFGGQMPNQTLVNDAWMYTAALDIWSPIIPTGSPPPGRTGMKGGTFCNSIFAVIAGHSPLTPGQTLAHVPTLLGYDSSTPTWTEKTFTGSVGVDFPDSVVYVSVAKESTGVIWMYGGQSYGTGVRHASDELWRLSADCSASSVLTTLSWELIGSGKSGITWPPAVVAPEMVYGDGKIFMFGGVRIDSGFIDFANMWLFDTAARTWSMQVTMNSPMKYGSYDLLSSAYLGGKVMVLGGLVNEPAYAQFSYNVPKLRTTPMIFTPQTNSWYTIKQPQPRAFHSMISYNGSLYLFGGLSDDGPLNDLWEFNTLATSPGGNSTEAHWHPIEGTELSPSPRFGHCAVRLAGILWIFGGRTEIGPVNDVYQINLDQSNRHWHELSGSGSERPSPRWEMECHVSVLAYAYIVVFGGFTAGGANNEVWQYLVNSDRWVLVKTQGEVRPSARGFAHSVVDWDIDLGAMFMYLWGGTETPDASDVIDDGWRLNLESFRWSRIWNTSDHTMGVLGSPLMSVPGAGSVLVSRSVLVYGGQMFFPETKLVSMPTFFILWPFPDGEEPTNIEAPEIVARYQNGRTGHTMNVIGSRVWIFGGQDVASTRHNDLFTFDFNTSYSSSFKCPRGSFMDTDKMQCTLCPPGFYENTPGLTVCRHCPEGFVSIAEGSEWRQLDCLACPTNTRPNQDRTACIPCDPTRELCVMAAAEPLQVLPSQWTNKTNTDQPAPLEGNVERVREVTTIIYSTGAAVGVAVIVVLAVLRRQPLVKTIVHTLDAFGDKHVDRPRLTDRRGSLVEVTVNQKTFFGGLFAILLLIACAMLVTSLTVPFIIDNRTELRSLEPLTLLQEAVTAEQMSAKIVAHAWRPACRAAANGGCAKGISLHASGIESSQSTSVSCEEEVDVWGQRACALFWTCDDCRLVSKEAQLQVKFGGYDFTLENACCDAVTVNVTMSSGTPGFTSSSETRSVPAHRAILRGAAVPVVYDYLVTPSLYRNPVDDQKSTGYQVRLVSTDFGAPIENPALYHYENGVAIDLNLVQATTFLQTTVLQKQTAQQLLSSCLGSVSGLLGAFGGTLVLLEMIRLRVKARLAKGKLGSRFPVVATHAGGLDDARQRPRATPLQVSNQTSCVACGQLLYSGETGLWQRGVGVFHEQCIDPAERPKRGDDEDEEAGQGIALVQRVPEPARESGEGETASGYA